MLLQAHRYSRSWQSALSGLDPDWPNLRWPRRQGSIRIHDEELQEKVFEKLGLGKEEQQEKFGFFLEVLKYGVPPHGGLAFGIDRWLMAMLKESSIKEVIPFPKTNKGQDLMTGAPAGVEESVLEEDLRLKLLEIEK